MSCLQRDVAEPIVAPDVPGVPVSPVNSDVRQLREGSCQGKSASKYKTECAAHRQVARFKSSGAAPSHAALLYEAAQDHWRCTVSRSTEQ